jgi:hypothetical protein
MLLDTHTWQMPAKFEQVISMSDPRVREPLRIQLQSRADGSTHDLPVGCYLASYDADGNDGWGEAVWTDNPAEAIAFATAIEARACWTEQSRLRPLRPDGNPNRPLTAFTILLG